jgi:uncharacterized membrane protein
MNYFSLYGMVALYLAAGTSHFLNPSMYRKIVPSVLPNPGLLVILSGACEILFALLLIFPKTRIFAAWGIILLLIVVFPANVQMMMNYYRASNPWFWLTIVRLPIQILLIFWAYGFTRS